MQAHSNARPAAQHLRLFPGEFAVASSSTCIHTLLGSCVSVTLWHPRQKVGAMSHFLLPSRRGRARAGPDARFGDDALDLMLAQLARLKVEPRQCQAKIFGGGSMFGKRGTHRSFDIGRQNGHMAQRLLQAHRIPIVSSSLFGEGHLNIMFDTGSGEVWSRPSALAR